jgi:ketosteroid isomerase-like protein
MHDIDDVRAVILLRLTGRARASGLPLDQELAQLWTWRGERVRRIVTYPDLDAAVKAAGSAE